MPKSFDVLFFFLIACLFNTMFSQLYLIILYLISILEFAIDLVNVMRCRNVKILYKNILLNIHPNQQSEKGYNGFIR